MKIKFCPICGDIPTIKTQPIRGYEPAVNYIIRCSNTECPLFIITQTCDTVYHSDVKAERLVKEKWNNYCSHVKKLLITARGE